MLVAPNRPLRTAMGPCPDPAAHPAVPPSPVHPGGGGLGPAPQICPGSPERRGAFPREHVLSYVTGRFCPGPAQRGSVEGP